MFLNTIPGDQVHVIPDWVYRTLAKKGQIEDLVNFSKMRQWFTQEQLVAIDAFSRNGLSILWNGSAVPKLGGGKEVCTRSIGYSWYFPEEAGQSKNGSDTDKYVRDQVSQLVDNKEYGTKMVDQYILDYFKEPGANKIDLHQSYSVYSASNKLIVLALGQGILSPVIFTRKEELRLAILRSIIEKLQMYYDLSTVHNTSWFELYLNELDRLK
jgi:hypothetical protein